MSSDSENDFFDALDITPESHLSEEWKAQEIKYQKIIGHFDTTVGSTKQSKLFLRTNVPTTKISSSSVPIFDPQDANVASAQKLLKNLDSSFSKETVITDMPPPVVAQKISMNTLQLEPLTKEEGETTSACSGSMLSYLGIEEAANRPVNERRRPRNRERKRDILPDRDEVSPIHQMSAVASRSSSTDAIFPSTSAPFRVVEHDASSVYSTNVTAQEKIVKVPTSMVEVCLSSENAVMTPHNVADSSPVQNLKFELGTEEALLLPEPDIVASTKANSLPRSDHPIGLDPKVGDPPVIQFKEDLLLKESPNTGSDGNSTPPVALTPPAVPPRRNKARRKVEETASISSFESGEGKERKAIEKKDFDIVSQILDISAATSGDYIVNPQDTVSCKGIGQIEDDLGCSTPEAILIPQKSANSPSHIVRKDSTSKPPAGKTSKMVKQLSDQEILSAVNILNLDTGESIPLSEAEAEIQPALNPLSLHIMKLTSEYTGEEDDGDSDEESIAHEGSLKLTDSVLVKRKAHRIKKFLGKKVESAMNKAKNIAQEVSQKGKEEKDIFEDDAPAQNTRQFVKIKTAHSHKGPLEFDNLMYAQELKGEHTGPVWCIKHSPCGRLLATAGQDHVLRVWVLKQAFNYFLDIRTKWNADVKSSPTPSQESLVSQVSSHSSEDLGTLDPNDDGLAPYMPKPFCVYTGHTADVLDMSWSKHYFILTSSMDKTARLWHISRKECLCIFKHVDFVTAIAFHPKDDRYFISGSLDGKLRLWSIPDKQVVLWNEVAGHPKLITAANFCQNGAYTVVGTYNGRCIFYKTAELKYYTQIHVKSSRGRHARKITGIEPLPDEDKLLITSNDSRIRLYDLNVLTVSCKYKGHSNYSSQIRAGFSHDGKYLVSGSENQCIYIWKTHHDYSKFTSARKDRNVYWEGVKAHSAVVTCAVFSPHPEHAFNFIEQQENMKGDLSNEDKHKDTGTKGYVLVSADFNGVIKVFLKKEKPKHSSLPASALA